jgi:hypothetical protein
MDAARAYIVGSVVTLVVLTGRLGFTDRPELVHAVVVIGVGLGMGLRVLLGPGLLFRLPTALLILVIVGIGKVLL